MATASQWIAGARPRTLPVSVAPVLIGTGAAIATVRAFGGSRHGWFAYAPLTDATFDPGLLNNWGWTEAGKALLALVVALALQVGVNYANDYSDGIRGTDDDRVGPLRLTGSGAATPGQVKRAAFAAFGVAGLAGLALVAWSGHWWLLIVGAACVLAAWYYTGGSRPYGYAGLGEASVFVFFGLVATLGTTYTQIDTVTWAAALGSVGTGALACAVLVANNLRDEPTDGASGKITLAVRLGPVTTRRVYVALLVLPFGTALVTVLVTPWALLSLLAVPLAVPPVRTVLSGAGGPALIPVLRDTGRLNLVYAVLLTAGLVISGPVLHDRCQVPGRSADYLRVETLCYR